MPSLSTTYLVPAILLNPAFILHLINTFVSHLLPPPDVVSQSPHPFMQSLGPVPGSMPYLDMHEDDQLCWRYTVLMVVVQILAFGRVQDNRVQRRSIQAAKSEREKIRKDYLERLEQERTLRGTKPTVHVACANGVRDLGDEWGTKCQAASKGSVNETGLEEGTTEEIESEECLIETSEEEMIV